jgi:hypothetical protein
MNIESKMFLQGKKHILHFYNEMEVHNLFCDKTKINYISIPELDSSSYEGTSLQEAQEKIKGGMPQQEAMMAVMQAHQEELKGAMGK